MIFAPVPGAAGTAAWNGRRSNLVSGLDAWVCAKGNAPQQGGSNKDRARLRHLFEPGIRAVPRRYALLWNQRPGEYRHAGAPRPTLAQRAMTSAIVLYPMPQGGANAELGAAPA